MAASGLPPLRNIPHSLPPVGRLGRVSSPSRGWSSVSDQLEIVGLVSLYLTNYLIPLGLILWHVARRSPHFHLPILRGISYSFP